MKSGEVERLGSRQSVTLCPRYGIWCIQSSVDMKGNVLKVSAEVLMGIRAAATTLGRARPGPLWKVFLFLSFAHDWAQLKWRGIGSTPVIVTNELLLKEEEEYPTPPALLPPTPNSWSVSKTTGFIIENNCRASQVWGRCKEKMATGRLGSELITDRSGWDAQQQCAGTRPFMRGQNTPFAPKHFCSQGCGCQTSGCIEIMKGLLFVSSCHLLGCVLSPYQMLSSPGANIASPRLNVWIITVLYKWTEFQLSLLYIF